MRAGKIGAVPPALRDAHYAGAKKLGHGHDYLYAHNDARGVVGQQYAPDDVDGATYYEPSEHGAEAATRRAPRPHPGHSPRPLTR